MEVTPPDTTISQTAHTPRAPQLTRQFIFVSNVLNILCFKPHPITKENSLTLYKLDPSPSKKYEKKTLFVDLDDQQMCVITICWFEW